MLKQKELILICIIVVVAIGIGCYIGKHEYFYMSKSQCEECRKNLYDEVTAEIFKQTKNNCLSDNKPCEYKYNSLVGIRCPGC